MKPVLSIILVLISLQDFVAQTLPVPPRSANALSGSEVVNLIWSMSREEREEQIFSQVVTGNVPEFMRQLNTVNATVNAGGTDHTVKYFVIPEYLAVGSDADYFLCPMTPLLAQRIANNLNCTLPTKKMVDQIYTTATLKLRPQPIPPTDSMTTVPVFAQHNDSVKSIRFPVIPQYPLGSLVGGTKKDVIISNRIYQNLNPNTPKPVVIYGWHQLNGTPIQPVYNGHAETYADYSHGIRLVLDSVIVDNNPTTFSQLLADPVLCTLVSDEGQILKPYYTISGNVTPIPKTFGVLWDSPTSLKVFVLLIPGITYKAFYGNDGLLFLDSTEAFTDNIIVNGLLTDSVYFFRLRAQNADGYSIPSEVLGASISESNSKVLVVNGFDRGSAGNSYNFIRQHGNAFKHNGYSFCSVTNEVVIQGLVLLQDYFIVDYILGDESTADETFSNIEQEKVKTYLRQGGNLFVSGTEVAWDLDNKGSASDKDFINNYLKSKYVYDAPNNQSSVFYKAEPVEQGIFDGLGIINYDNGTQGTINVAYPDVINGINGGVNCLKYSNLTNQFAAVNFAGLFPNGTQSGKVVYVGFPFETIYPEETRNEFLNKIITFFEVPINISDEFNSIPESFALFQNYPNPFNPGTRISWQTPVSGWQTLKVFDILGSEVATLVDEYREAGRYEVEFTAGQNNNNLSSGVYIYKLQAGNFVTSKKMLFLK